MRCWSSHQIASQTCLCETMCEIAYPSIIRRHDGPKWTQQLRCLIVPDHVHALSHPIALHQCDLQPYQQVKTIELWAGCWDGHTTVTDMVCPLYNNGELVPPLHIIGCDQCHDNVKFRKIEKKAEFILASLESKFSNKGDIEIGQAINKAVMLGWLPSVIEITDEDSIFIHIHKMDENFLDKLKELYT